MLSVNLHHHNSHFWIISCIGSFTVTTEYREKSPNLSQASPQTTVKPTQPTSCGHLGKEPTSATAFFLEWDTAEKKRAVVRPLKIHEILTRGLRAVVPLRLWFSTNSRSSPPPTTIHSSPEQNLNKAEDVTLYVLYLACNLNALFLPCAILVN